MTTERSTIEALADAVASGRTVDWDAAEQSAETVQQRGVVQQLGVLAALANVHWAGAPQADDNPPLTRWGRFESLTPIGRGANGTVYQCWDPLLERAVALKLLHSSAADDRTLAEARLLAKVRHPNIVTVYGVDRADGRLGIWMEHLTGRTLKDDVGLRGPLPVRDAGVVGADLCRGLAAVHAARLVHGDVKAQNVIREQDGRVVLMDFGAGVNHDASAIQALAIAGGTPHYMADELFEGRSVSVRSDVYSVGVLLFYLVTGEFPFKGSSIEELMEARRSGRRRAVRDLRPDVPAAFARVIEQAIAPKPEDRFATARELEAAIQKALPAADGARGLRRRVVAWSAVIVVAIVALLAWLRPAANDGAASAVKSIAVLPFANLSGSAEEEYLADGVWDMLTSDLAQLNAVRVTSRTSSARYKNPRESLQAIGQALHVDALVEGSVTHVKGRVRVNAQVIRVSTDEHVWSQTFERADDDLFRLQAEMASAIAGAIKLAVTPKEQQRLAVGQAVKPAAQDAYLRGRYFLDQTTAQSQLQAFDYLKRAIELDPSYARAYSSLARNYVRLEMFRTVPRTVAYPAAYDAATRAVGLDPDLDDGHAELADILLYHKWEWSAAEREYRRALELNRSNTRARSRYSRYLSAIGRHDDALQHARLTVDNDPFSIEARGSVALALYYSGDFADAANAFQHALELFPNTAVYHFGRGRALAEARDLSGAEREIREALRLTENSTTYRLELARTIAAAGRREESLQLLGAIESSSPQPIAAEYRAYIETALGNADTAFAHLNRAVQERAPDLLWAKVDPRLTPLRSDPRFELLVQTLGIPK